MKKPIKYLFRKLEIFFLWSSGANLEILNQVPVEKNKYLGIGGTILFTALMASFAGGYAFFTAFKSTPLSFFFGIFWGALIFNLDRFIVSTFGSGDGKKTISKQELVEASPRLLMAILLGFVISTPLELKIFEKEIKVRLDRLKIEKKEDLVNSDSTFNKTLNNKRNEITNINNKIDLYNTQKNQLLKNNVSFLSDRKNELESQRKLKNSEVQKYGNLKDNAQAKLLNSKESSLSPSEINSLQSIFQDNNSKYNSAIRERSDLDTKIINLQNNEQSALIQASDNINSQIASLSTQRNSLVGDISDLEKISRLKDKNYTSTSEDYDGFAAHLEAMDALTSEKPILFYVKWLITFLFIFIEIAPILFKMMTERGPYDDTLDRIKHEHKVRQLELQSNLNQEINVAIRIHTDKFEQKLNAELDANKELLETITKAQKEIAVRAIEIWTEEQKAKLNEKVSSIITSQT